MARATSGCQRDRSDSRTGQSPRPARGTHPTAALTGVKLRRRAWQHREVVLSREPGGTDLGVELREIILHRRGYIAPRAEALIYAADRAHHIAAEIDALPDTDTCIRSLSSL